MGRATNAMSGAARALAVLAVLSLPGCARQGEAFPSACFAAEPAEVLSTLEQAPGAVTLADGTRLSRCVSAARTDGELQSLGLTFMRAADALRADARSQPTAALRLGYLAGAVSAGAARSSGSIAAQLARRVDQAATLGQHAAPESLSALARGRRAGELNG